jgi:hypothetical protein
MCSKMLLKPRRTPLGGYNHNVLYQERMFHAQTEDSGLERTRIFTHLFHDGAVVETLRMDYGHLTKDEDEAERVRQLMQQQHKQVLRRLKTGELDKQIARLLGSPSDAADSPPPAPQARQPASSLCKALGHMSERELHALRHGRAVSRELATVADAVPAGIPLTSLSEYPTIEIGAVDNERNAQVLELVLDAAVAPHQLDEALREQRTTKPYHPALPRPGTPMERSLVEAIQTLEPIPVTVGGDD